MTQATSRGGQLEACVGTGDTRLAMSASCILGLASLLSSIARNQHDREASVHNSGLTLMRRSDRRVLSNSCQRDAAPWPGQSATGILRAMRRRTAWGLMRIYRFRSQTFVHGGQWAMQCVIQVFVSSTRRGLGPDPGSGNKFHQNRRGRARDILGLMICGLAALGHGGISG